MKNILLTKRMNSIIGYCLLFGGLAISGDDQFHLRQPEFLHHLRNCIYISYDTCMNNDPAAGEDLKRDHRIWIRIGL